MKFMKLTACFLLLAVFLMAPVTLFPDSGNAEKTEEKIIVLEEGESDEYMFKRITALAIAGNGNFYVLDFDRILSYDKKGKFLKYIGGLGEGPGEYKNPRGLYVDDKNQLFILDYQRIIRYSSQGKFVENFSIDVSLSSPFFVRFPGAAFGAARKFTEHGMVQTLCKAGLKTGKASHLYFVKDKETKVKGGPAGGVMGGMKHAYSSEVLLAPLPDRMLCFASNSKAEIRIIDSDGNNVTTIDMDIKPERLDSEELKFYEKKYGKNAAKRLRLPEHRPILDRLLSDEEGRVYVFMKKKVTDTSPSRTVHVFNPEGKRLQTMTINILPWVIRGSYFYTVEKTGDFEFVIFKVKI